MQRKGGISVGMFFGDDYYLLYLELIEISA